MSTLKSKTALDHRICFVGDSFVQGTGDPLSLGWAGRVTQDAVARGIQVNMGMNAWPDWCWTGLSGDSNKANRQSTNGFYRDVSRRL